uniref:Uncharacterized protein n=1 Tax=Avena sativa TaxID=4498 RepID=A0ACD5UIX8_AVESA
MHALHTMAATQDKLFALVEPAPRSPSLFLDCPPSTAHGDSQEPQDDLALAYISHMLMEEDITVDRFFYGYPDHPMVLQAEQPFAEILSASGTTSSESDARDSSALLVPGHMVSGFLSGGEVHDPTFLLNVTVTAEEPSGSSTGMGMLSTMAFLKGMEEATRFLPTHNGFGETAPCTGRSSKLIVPVHTEEADTAVEMPHDLLTLDGYPGDKMKERGDKQASQQSVCRKAPRVRRCARQALVADLETLLIRCAEAVAASDRRTAGDLLEQIKRHSLPTGDATQRLAHYFALGLEARLAGTGWQLYHSITMPKQSYITELLKLYHSCCFLKVAIHFSNKSICNAVAGRKKLHIVHYGANNEFQWPELLRWLACREGGPPEVRLTGIASPQPAGLCPATQAAESERRLSYCASQLGVPFKFRSIIAKFDAVRAEDLDIDPDEVLVVNNMFNFRTLMDESLGFDTVNPRDLVLGTVREMKPSVFVHAAVNGSYSSALFKTRFRQTLRNFTAQFDMMATTMPRERDNGRRVLLEREVFARRAMNIIACEGADRVERPQNYKEWQAQNRRAGLRQLPLDPGIVEVLKDQVKEQYHRHFMVNEDGRWLLLGWKGTMLYALSTWGWGTQADDR